ncbi:cuticle protein-like [Lucilia cuprina]|uniref:cuticle protein-like n=2 Tax=Lucilia cuprina TaxID=7375 RepID=UPI001F05985B|nr:cuticle protein-like [Lucilia cuprina]
MAFKFITFCTLLAAANAGYVSPVTYAAAPVVKYVNPAVDAVATTQQNVVRSFGGTVSSYSKSVDTPYSSVRKVDTRINNNVYTPAVAKTVTYAAPTVTYASPAVTKTVYAAHATPVVAKTVAYSAPTVYTHAAPAVTKTVYSHESPLVYAKPALTKTVTYAAPTATTSYNHGPAATTYTHSAPGVSGYGTSQTVHYSPAETVSHMSFDGFGTHWGFNNLLTMAFKFITFCTLLAAASAGYVAPVTYAASPVVKYVNPAVDAVASTQQNVVRSFGGTVSSYSKTVQTPYSSVSKVDTRISNNVYTPAVAKTVTYAAPALTKTVSYAAPAVHYAAPAPVYTKTLVSSPVPTVNTYAAHAPVVYSHAAPVVKQAIAYSPAATVAHVSFDGFGSHWGY